MEKVRVRNKPTGSRAGTRAKGPRTARTGGERASPADDTTPALVQRLKRTLADFGRLGPMRDPISELEEMLTPPQVHTIIWLGVDGPQSQSEVAQRVHCSSPTMTGIVDRLERDGYVERARDPVDRRVTRLHLTDAGKQVFHRIDEAMTMRFERLFAVMDKKDCVILVDVLGRVVSAIQKVRANLGMGQASREEKA